MLINSDYDVNITKTITRKFANLFSFLRNFIRGTSTGTSYIQLKEIRVLTKLTPDNLENTGIRKSLIPDTVPGLSSTHANGRTCPSASQSHWQECCLRRSLPRTTRSNPRARRRAHRPWRGARWQRRRAWPGEAKMRAFGGDGRPSGAEYHPQEGATKLGKRVPPETA